MANQLKQFYGWDDWKSLETHITSVNIPPGGGPLRVEVEVPEGIAEELSNWTNIPTPQIDDLVAAYAGQGVRDYEGMVGKPVMAIYSSINLVMVQPRLPDFVPLPTLGQH